ncbi:hypothetical protein L9F63_015114, partial [Diploptera punctata]
VMVWCSYRAYVVNRSYFRKVLTVPHNSPNSEVVFSLEQNNTKRPHVVNSAFITEDSAENRLSSDLKSRLISGQIVNFIHQ